MNTDLIIAMYESAKLNGELERFYKLHKQRRRGLITDFAYIVQFYGFEDKRVLIDITDEDWPF